MITKATTRQTALQTTLVGRQRDDRKEFLAFVDALESRGGRAKADALWKIARGLSSEPSISHLLAVWPEVERKRRRRTWLRALREHAGFVCAFPLTFYASLRMLGSTPAVSAFIANPEGYRVFCVVAAACWACTCLLLTGLPGKRQRGLIRLLLDTKDVRLVPAYLDALYLKGDVEKGREALITHLTEFLPHYAYADAPPLDSHQRRILIREIQRRSRAARGQSHLSDEDARFLTAALQALEMEIARTAPGSSRAEDARERREERVLRETASATQVSGGRSVAQAAEDCLLRLEVRGGGSS